MNRFVGDRWQDITPEDALRLSKPTDGYLCPISANTYGIEFLDFSIIDYETKDVIFNIARDYATHINRNVDFENFNEDSFRCVKYEFPEDVLRLPSIQNSLVFVVGDKPAPKFQMVERHYFRNQLVKSFDFQFGFCIPNSKNTWDAVYYVPLLEDGLIQEMIDNPYETSSDSFYFVDGCLIMHNKARYTYSREEAAQPKKSYEDCYYESKTAKLCRKLSSKYDSDEEEGINKGRAATARCFQEGAEEKIAYSDDRGFGWSKDSDYY